MKKLKTMIIGIVIGLLIGTAGTALAAGETVQATFQKFVFKVNGQELHLEADPLVYRGTTYLPVRVVANMLGYDVTYKADSRAIEMVSMPEEKTLPRPAAAPQNKVQGVDPVETTMTTHRIGEEFTLGDLTMKVNGITISDSYNEFVASDGQVFAIVNLDVFTAKAPTNSDWWPATTVVRGAKTSDDKLIVGGMFGTGPKGQFNPNEQANIEAVIPISAKQEVTTLLVSDPSDASIAAEVHVQ